MLALSGCQKEKWFGRKDAIRFTVGTPGTKASYSGVVTDGKERIDWAAGDVIRIYSDKSKHRINEDQYWADYVIKNPRTSESDATISEADIANFPDDGTSRRMGYRYALLRK